MAKIILNIFLILILNIKLYNCNIENSTLVLVVEFFRHGKFPK